MPWLMQARSSTDGTLKTWTTDFPDWTGREFPGPGNPENIAAFEGIPTRRDVPKLLPLDSNTPLRWRFQESASPYLNEGTRGSAGNMIAFSGDGTVYKGGQSDGRFGLGLKFGMDPSTSPSSQASLRSPDFTWPTSEITVSCWITPTRAIGANQIGRIFFKSRNDAAWNDPWYSVSLQYGLFGVGVPNDLTAGFYYQGGINERAYFQGDRAGVNIGFTHHVGFTWGGGRLKGYVDGYLHWDVPTAQAFSLGAGSWCLGTPPSTSLNEFFGGIVHEIRVCSVVRPASWWRDSWIMGNGRTYVTQGVPRITSLNFDQTDTAGGDRITAYGTDLVNVSQVTVGGTAGTVVATTETSVTFDMPAKTAGSHNIQVFSPGGSSNTLPIEFWSPEQETLSVFVHAPYSGSPWVGRQSLGTSGTRNLSQATAPPVGQALFSGGPTACGFNGTSGRLEPSDGAGGTVLHTAGAGTTVVGFRANAAFTDQGGGSAFNNPAFELGVAIAATFSTSGWRAGVDGPNEAWDAQAIACAPGSWNIGILRWQNASPGPGQEQIALNNTTFSSQPTSTVGVTSGTVWFGQGNAPGNVVNADVAFILTSPVAISDASLTKIIKWARAKFRVFL